MKQNPPVQWNRDQPESADLVPTRDVMMYNNGTAVTAGEAVRLDPAYTSPLGVGFIEHTAAAASAAWVIGAAVDDIGAGEWGLVRVQGIQAGVKLASSTAAGAILVGSAAAAGTLATQSATYAATHHPVARCVVAESGGTGTVQWFGNSGY